MEKGSSTRGISADLPGSFASRDIFKLARQGTRAFSPFRVVTPQFPPGSSVSSLSSAVAPLVYWVRLGTQRHYIGVGVCTLRLLLCPPFPLFVFTPRFPSQAVVPGPIDACSA